jgi:uncharacterized membrane protein YoaK (UPF0700 family)
MLTAKLVPLILGAYLAIRLSPFVNGDAWPAILTGMTLVSAMAIQNAVHRIHLGTAPPTTLMTETTTQIMIDVADAIRGLSPDARVTTLFRLRHMAVAILTFAFGAAAAAYLFSQLGSWCHPWSRLPLGVRRMRRRPARRRGWPRHRRDPQVDTSIVRPVL